MAFLIILIMLIMVHAKVVFAFNNRELQAECIVTLIKDKQNNFPSITVFYHQTTEPFYT